MATPGLPPISYCYISLWDQSEERIISPNYFYGNTACSPAEYRRVKKFYRQLYPGPLVTRKSEPITRFDEIDEIFKRGRSIVITIQPLASSRLRIINA